MRASLFFYFYFFKGEYIAPEKVENICVRSKYIAQIFLYGDSLRSSCVAIVVPDEEVLLGWAASNGHSDVSFEELCREEVMIYILILYSVL